MPLETATTINQLVATNPAETDSEGQGADHLRLIKSTLLATFPNVTGVVHATQGALSQGGVPSGAMFHFPLDPGSSTVARGGTATGTETFIECDGSSYTGATFPGLGTFFGVGSGTFTVPNLKDTGRFIRSRGGSATLNTTQANQNAAHTHGNTLNDPGHNHSHSDPGHAHGVSDPSHAHGVSDPTHAHGASSASSSSSFVSDPGHTHTLQIIPTGLGPTGGLGTSGSEELIANTGGWGGINAAGTGILVSTSTSTSTSIAASGTGIGIFGAFTGVSVNGNTTNISNVANTTGISITNAASGSSEARPEAFVALCVIKT